VRKLGNASRVYTSLICTKRSDLTLDSALGLARELARQESIPATDAELEGGAVQYLLRCSLRAGDLAACELLAARAFELMREDTTHCVQHREWVQLLLAASRCGLADAVTLEYLEYLDRSDQSTLSTQNRILYWAALLQEHRAALPRSVGFFVANFPDEDLDGPLAVQRFAAKERPATRASSPKAE
jgi:hypothetical protein